MWEPAISLRDTMKDGDSDKDAALTEPVIVHDTFVTGTVVEIGEGYLRIVGWARVPNPAGEREERRIKLRIVLPTSAGRDLGIQLKDATKKSGH